MRSRSLHFTYLNRWIWEIWELNRSRFLGFDPLESFGNLRLESVVLIPPAAQMIRAVTHMDVALRRDRGGCEGLRSPLEKGFNLSQGIEHHPILLNVWAKPLQERSGGLESARSLGREGNS